MPAIDAASGIDGEDGVDCFEQAFAPAFAARGFRVEVFERAEKFEAVGAGIQLSPNATRILGALGVLDSSRQDLLEILEAERFLC